MGGFYMGGGDVGGEDGYDERGERRGVGMWW